MKRHLVKPILGVIGYILLIFLGYLYLVDFMNMTLGVPPEGGRPTTIGIIFTFFILISIGYLQWRYNKYFFAPYRKEK